jgi:RHS repeat-associated protein
VGNNGNLTCEYTGPNCSHGAITKETDAWWSFNMAHTISEGTTSLTFTYDSEHARILQALTNGSTTTTTTYLNDAVSGGMEDHVVSGSTTTWNDYLMADGKLIAERTCSAPTPTCSSGVTTQYLITDHLGSVGVVTDGTPGSSTFAQVTVRESFDAWGRERNPDWSDDNTCSTPLTAPSTRGFTGQEEIASLCLVNLNARIYDPSIGRFTSADSVIPDPTDGQSYNRYTYTDNRPLSLTDPTGNDPDGPQLGSCGIVCISFWSGQLLPGSYPNATCSGDCPLGSGIGPSEDPSGTTLLDRVSANGGKNMSISQNSNGDNALIQDPTENETATSGLTDSAQAQTPPNGDPSSVAQTAAAHNASGDSNGAPTQIETVVVTAERKAALQDVHSGNVSGASFQFGPTNYGHSGPFSWGYSTYVGANGLHGERITLKYTGDTKGLQWIQTYTESQYGHQVGPTNDHQSDSTFPFYDSRNDLQQAPGVFVDTPATFATQDSFRADLSLVRLDDSGKFATVGAFTYGFNVSNSDVTLVPVMRTGP